MPSVQNQIQTNQRLASHWPQYPLADLFDFGKRRIKKRKTININLVVASTSNVNEFQAVPELKVMKKRMVLMIWRMNFRLQTMGMILTTLLNLCLPLALMSDAAPMPMVQCTPLQRWMPLQLLERSLS